MTKLRDNYNKTKPTHRQIKKNKQKQINKDNVALMCTFLQEKWKNEVNFVCEHCLRCAYESELNDIQGYVTDEDLIKSSNYKLEHK